MCISGTRGLQTDHQIRINPRIAVIGRPVEPVAPDTGLGQRPAKADAARKLASIGQIKALRTETISTKRTHAHGVTYALTDTRDQVTFREQHALHLDLRAAYCVQACTKSEAVLAKARRTIARLHAEQEAINAANVAAAPDR
jgi:hypothetical protein